MTPRQSGKPEQIDLEKGEIGLHSTPTIVGDIVDCRLGVFRRAQLPAEVEYAAAWSRAFDVRTGKQLWKFDPFPKRGELGYDTWENDSLELRRQHGRVGADHRR